MPPVRTTGDRGGCAASFDATTTVDDAAVLAREDLLQFQAWALELVGARPFGLKLAH